MKNMEWLRKMTSAVAGERGRQTRTTSPATQSEGLEELYRQAEQVKVRRDAKIAEQVRRQERSDQRRRLVASLLSSVNWARALGLAIAGMSILMVITPIW
jgi:hypothetical protein